MNLNIIYEDSYIIAINKPFGTLCQNDKNNNEDSLHIMVDRYLKEKGECYNLSIINRLDRVVGGIVIFSKNKKTTTILTEYMKEHKFEKKYLAVVYGSAKSEDILIDWIMKNQRLNISKIVNKNSSGAKEAILHYKKLEEVEYDSKKISLVEIDLKTGRHHQIRVQMANIDLPIFRDFKYSKQNLRIRGQGDIGLFCYKMKFKHPITSNEICIKVDIENSDIFEKFNTIKERLI